MLDVQVDVQVDVWSGRCHDFNIEFAWFAHIDAPHNAIPRVTETIYIILENPQYQSIFLADVGAGNLQLVSKCSRTNP